MVLRPSSRPVAQIAVDQPRRAADAVVIGASFSTGAATAARWPVPAPALALHRGIEHRRIRPAPLLLMHKDAINSYCALHHPWLRCRPSAAAARTLAIPPSTVRIVAVLRLRGCLCAADRCEPSRVTALQGRRALRQIGSKARRQGRRRLSCRSAVFPRDPCVRLQPGVRILSSFSVHAAQREDLSPASANPHIRRRGMSLVSAAARPSSPVRASRRSAQCRPAA